MFSEETNHLKAKAFLTSVLSLREQNPAKVR